MLKEPVEWVVESSLCSFETPCPLTLQRLGHTTIFDFLHVKPRKASKRFDSTSGCLSNVLRWACE